MTESRALTDKLNILSLPQYLMFYDSHLVYQGTLGGSALRVRSSIEANAPYVLLVEPSFRHQAVAEKMLRKYGCRWNLCMDARGALALKQATPDRCYDLLLLGDDLPLADVREISKAFSSGGAIMVGMASVTGEQGADRTQACQWKKAVTQDVDRLFENNPPFTSFVKVRCTSLPGRRLDIVTYPPNKRQ